MPTLTSANVATNDIVASTDHNKVVTDLGNINAALPSNGDAALTYDYLGNPASATDGAETYTYGTGAHGTTATASDGTTTVTANRDAAGNLTSITTT